MKITRDLQGREARKAPTTDYAGGGSIYRNCEKTADSDFSETTIFIIVGERVSGCHL